MSDIKTILITNPIISDITDELAFAVTDDASQKTFQQFASNTASNNQVSFNVQIPNLEIITVRSPKIQLSLYNTITISGFAAGDVGVLKGSNIFQYGLTDSYQSFPFARLIQNASSLINNTNVSSSLNQFLDLYLRFYDNRKMGAYESTTPSQIDNAFYNYSDAVGAINNPMSDYSTSLDSDFKGRGSFPLESLIVVYLPAGNPADAVIVDYGTELEVNNVNDIFYVYIKVNLVEPILGLSPISSLEGFESCHAGFFGLNTFNLNFTIDNSCKRLWSTSNSYIQNIQLGWLNVPTNLAGSITARQNGFAEVNLLMEFLGPTPYQVAKLKSTKNVLPYYDNQYYITNQTNNPTINSGLTRVLTFNNIQLSAIPDYFCIAVRKQLSTQSWTDSASFLTITNITVNFNSASGLLSSATNIDLFNLSKKNGYNGSYYEFNGAASQVSTQANAGDFTGGQVVKVPTTGSCLILSPGDLSIPVWASSSSLGQFQLTFNITVYNQTSQNIQAEVVLFCPTSGIFITNNGVSQSEVGVLDKSTVLKAKEGHSDSISRHEAMRLIGGAGPNHMGQLFHRLKHSKRGMMGHHHHHGHHGHHEHGAGMGGNMGGSMSGGKHNRMC